MITKNKYRCIYCNAEIELRSENKTIIVCPYCNRRQVNNMGHEKSSEYKFLVPWVIPDEMNQINKIED
jgi:DNA-directed RNA polymerase subunit RPC12/RpoP